MKTFYMVGGPMGVGKSAVCSRLNRILPNSVLLDGDWCWAMDPFQVTRETRELVLSNICHMLRNFLACPAFEHVIFCWVMHQQEIIDQILARVDCSGWEVRRISLVCRPEVLTERLQRDVELGRRSPDVIGRSLAYLPLYQGLDTEKIEVSGADAEEVAERLAGLARPA